VECENNRSLHDSVRPPHEESGSLSNLPNMCIQFRDRGKQSVVSVSHIIREAVIYLLTFGFLPRAAPDHDPCRLMPAVRRSQTVHVFHDNVEYSNAALPQIIFTFEFYTIITTMLFQFKVFNGSFRRYASTLTSTGSKRRLNIPIDYTTTPLLHHNPQSLSNAYGLSEEDRSKRLNLCQAVNEGLRFALREDKRVLCFGEDVAFGGVFRCTTNLQTEFGDDRVFNTPLTEQGIVGMAIGAAAEGRRPVVEIQFADYVFPAFDQLVNEAAKFRYREGRTGANLGGMVIRMPCGGVGHGALYATCSNLPNVSTDSAIGITPSPPSRSSATSQA
jgi:hypothetical protein